MILWLRSFLFGRRLVLATMPYADYLHTWEWRRRRAAALRRAGWRCQICNRAGAPGVPLDVHHRTYERRGHEAAGDLIVLCRRCHGLYHDLLVAGGPDGAHPKRLG